MATSFNKDGILSRLRQLDDDLLSLYPDKAPFSITIVGGSAIVLRDLASNKTQTVDIDALRAEEELEELFSRYDINTHVDTFLFQFPTNFEHRLVEVEFSGSMLRVLTLSNEDLAITKLIAWRKQDQEDLYGMLEVGSIDTKKLVAILNDDSEVRINIEEKDWQELLAHLAALGIRIPQ